MEEILTWTQVFWLAVVQGLTEFLPISSSAHLILLPTFFNWPDQGLAFDVAVHLGSLLAVMIYFRQDIWAMVHDWTISIAKRRPTSNSRLAWAVIFATIPAVAFGMIISSSYTDAIRSEVLIGVTSIVFGALLWYSDIKGKRERDEHTLSYKDIAILGFSQALALIPGVSRSGITITAGLLIGLTRQAAARFSFLMAIPVILGSGILETRKLIKAETVVHWDILVIGAVISFLVAYLVIALFLRWINQIGMAPFAWYRFALGALLLVLFL